MIAARKRNRLKTRSPVKRCPFRPATRAGQNAMALQMTANKIHQDGHGRLPFPPSCGTLLLPDGSAGYRRRCRTGPSCAPPGHHTGRGDLR